MAYDVLGDMGCSWKVADLIKWCACDCSWIYWRISSPSPAGSGTRWWLDALRGWWRRRCAFSCLWWWTCWLHTPSPAPSAGSSCKGPVFCVHGGSCWPRAAEELHLQEDEANTTDMSLTGRIHTHIHTHSKLHKISGTAACVCVCVWEMLLQSGFQVNCTWRIIKNVA